ncbi:MAG: SMC-Scp complex subunit ScpB [Nitrospirae bacterium]|nr:SMC-Scp complex subunit ScpB [Nitrospirota bacterium]
MEDKEAKSILEAVLFISGDPISPDSLSSILEVDRGELDRLVKELVNDYTINNTGLLVAEVAGGVQMVTNPACAPWIRKLLATSVPAKLSQQSLETLAIIAYKQPIIKAEIEAIRGVNSDGVVKTLLDRKLVKILGRKEVPGRPLMYGTTKEFLQHFGLKDLSELPTLKEFQEFETPEAPEQVPSEQEMPEYAGTDQQPAEESVETSQDEVHAEDEGEAAITENADPAEEETIEDSVHRENDDSGEHDEEERSGQLP